MKVAKSRQPAVLTARIDFHCTGLTRLAPRAAVAIAGRSRSGGAAAGVGIESDRVRKKSKSTKMVRAIAAASIKATMASGHRRGPRHHQAKTTSSTMTDPKKVAVRSKA